jgi:Integrase core domain
MAIFIRRIGLWAFATDRSRRGRLGRTDMQRLIGSIRRECLDPVVVVGERHLRHVLALYQKYYNEVRTHLSLQKDAPVRRDVFRTGRVGSSPILGGLHHQYVRV